MNMSTSPTCPLHTVTQTQAVQGMLPLTTGLGQLAVLLMLTSVIELTRIKEALRQTMTPTIPYFPQAVECTRMSMITA